MLEAPAATSLDRASGGATLCPHLHPCYAAGTMTESGQDAVAKFVENIVHNLEKNGFPERRVALPLVRMYESADAKGVSFNKVLDELAARGISHEKTPEKVIFVRAEEPSPPGVGPLEGLDLGAFEGLPPDQMMAAAAALMQQLGPEQLAAMQAAVENLSDEDKAELVERARKLGLA